MRRGGGGKVKIEQESRQRADKTEQEEVEMTKGSFTCWREEEARVMFSRTVPFLIQGIWGR
eukprot:615417-Hanusia_phi.AAC.1